LNSHGATTGRFIVPERTRCTFRKRGDEDGLLEVRQRQVMEAKDHVREIHGRLLKVERAQVFELAARDGKTLVELQYLDAERLGFLE
jgi:hypothetical protein